MIRVATPTRESGVFTAGNAIAARSIAVLIGVISSIVLARGLGSEGRGRFAIAAAVLGIGVQVVTLGLHASLPYYAARSPDAARRLLADGVRRMSLASVAFGLAVAGWAALGEPDWYRDCGATLTLIALVAVPAAGLQLLSQAMLLGLGRTMLYCWVAPPVMAVTVLTLLALLWAGTLSPASALVASGLVALATGIWIVSSIASGTGAAPHFSEQWSYMWRSWVIALLATMPPRVLTLALPSRAPLGEVGVWGVALTIVETMNSIAASVIAVRLAPLLADRGDGGTFWRAAWVSVAGVFASTAVMCGAVALVLPFLLPLGFGADFASATGIVVACMPGVVAYSTSAMLQSVLAARGQPPSAMLAPSVSVGATLAVLLVPGVQSGTTFAWAYSAQASVAMAVSAAVTVRVYRHRHRAASRQP
ncbi:MAG: lipopolysaccharide biosynthesis protein [Actinobacteria bacterium]|nr:lipopolysaccharide biosynthesis protein [Actinomycetota bacterium]